MKTVDDIVQEITTNHAQIMDDFCKAYLSAIYKPGDDPRKLIKSIELVSMMSPKEQTWSFRKKYTKQISRL